MKRPWLARLCFFAMALILIVSIAFLLIRFFKVHRLETALTSDGPVARLESYLATSNLGLVRISSIDVSLNNQQIPLSYVHAEPIDSLSGCFWTPDQGNRFGFESLPDGQFFLTFPLSHDLNGVIHSSDTGITLLSVTGEESFQEILIRSYH